MSLFNMFKRETVNEAIDRFKATEGAVLIDLRDPQDYEEGHIAGSIQLSPSKLDQIANHVQGKETPIFLYCYSGVNSRIAQGRLQDMGYTQVNNVGGINAYSGGRVKD